MSISVFSSDLICDMEMGKYGCYMPHRRIPESRRQRCQWMKASFPSALLKGQKWEGPRENWRDMNTKFCPLHFFFKISVVSLSWEDAQIYHSKMQASEGFQDPSFLMSYEQSIGNVSIYASFLSFFKARCSANMSASISSHMGVKGRYSVSTLAFER